MLKVSVITILVGFLESLILALIVIPILKKKKANQRLSEYLEEKHSNKKNTPTMGGIIFVIPPIFNTIFLLLFHKIEFSYNLVMVLITFVLFSLIGFIDDALIIKRNNNDGLSEKTKFILILISSFIFLYLFLISKNEPLLWIHSLNIKLDIGFLYALFIVLILVSTSNAVNITDGLDGLASGLSIISLIAFNIILLSSGWLDGYIAISIFVFTLIGSLILFLFLNMYPAKIFMGDTGSLPLGSIIGMLSILTRHELLLIIIGLVFVLETASCIIQRVYYKVNKRRIFPMTPIHHTFEKKMSEIDVVKIFWLIGFVAALIALAFGVIL